MATWLTHLRIANMVLNEIKIKNDSLFIVGSIAPDNSYQPDISHWCIGSDKSTCKVEDFYKEFIENKTESEDIDFYLGYYVHLLTDVLWQKKKLAPLIKQSIDLKSIKQKWKNVDFHFLSKNHYFPPLLLLKQVPDLKKKWFKYCDVDTVDSLVDYIVLLSEEQSEVNVDIYAELEIEQFIDECAKSIINNMKSLFL